MACSLYRVKYLNDLGYVVYRHCFDESRCAIEDGIREHKNAVFVIENDAKHYAAFRNQLTNQNGTDALPPL